MPRRKEELIMFQDPAWFLTLIFIGLADVMMVYFASRAAVNDTFTIKKIKFEHHFCLYKLKERSPFSHKISTLEVLLAFLYAVIIGWIPQFINIDRLAIQLIIMICGIFFAILFSQHKLSVSIVIYIIVILFFGIIQVPLLPLLTNDEYSILQHLLPQTLTLIVIIILSHGFKTMQLGTFNFINRVFSLTQQDLVFKIITLVLFAFVMGVMATMNFDMNIGATRTLLFIPLIVFPLYSIWDILNDAKKRVNEASRKTHDYNQKLYGLHTSLQLLVGDNEEIMRESSEILQLIDRDITPERITTYTRDMAIFELLDNKAEELKSSGIKITFYPTFEGEENHQIVSFADTIAMMLSLVNNAIDHGNHQFPIWIDILIKQDILQIAVANACCIKSDFEIDKMFTEGYSSAPQVGRGYGLSNLKDDLQRYEKDGYVSGLLADSFYSSRKSTDYLMITIYVIKSGTELNVDDIKLKKELLS